MKKIIYKVIFVLSCLVIICCAFALIKMYLPKTDDDKIEKYKKETVATSENLPDNPIDFDKLQKQNSDVYAWITIPKTRIDYPIAQASRDEDDNFYLDHNIDRKYDSSGMIYSQKKNSFDFTDPVTVLYGHDMKNGTMFKDLHKFQNEKFFKKSKTIYIYIPGHKLTYTIVSAYVYDDRHILNSFDFSKKKVFKKYINSLTNPKSIVANVREDVAVTTDDRILTLSTCTGYNSQRYLVQGVLTDDTITK